MNKVRRVLINLIRATVPPGITGTVKSVDEENYTCVVTPYDEGADYHEVRLKVNVDDQDHGMVAIPDVGSEVLLQALFNDSRAYFVSKASKVKKWHLKTVSGGIIQIDENGNIEVNGNDFGGTVKVEELVEKLNAVENDLNTLKSLVSGWVPVASDGGAALKAVLTAWYGQQLALSSKVQLENSKVKHGEGV